MTRPPDFPYPLTPSVPESFCHPIDPLLASPFHHAGDICAANGYLAIRCHRGQWHPTDFQDAPPDALTRFHQLPWDTFTGTTLTHWADLHDLRPQLFKFRSHPLWTPAGRIATSPVVLLGGTHLVRLSILQHISRLPRAELLLGKVPGGHLPFRFTGGTGFIAWDTVLSGVHGTPGLSPYSRPRDFQLLKPRESTIPTRRETQQRVEDIARKTGQPTFHQNIATGKRKWPPIDTTEDTPPPTPVDE